MKYIVTKTPENVEEVFTFPDTINHDDMMNGIKRVKYNNFDRPNILRIPREPISAGFVVDNKCVGESVTLKLSSRRDDTKLLIESQQQSY